MNKKIPSKIFRNWIQECNTKITHHNQVVFILEIQIQLNVLKPINVTYYINRQNLHSNLNRFNKDVWQITIPLLVESVKRLGIKGTHVNIIDSIYKSTDNITLNKKKLEAFPLKSGTSQGCPHSLLLVNIILQSSLCQ